MPVTTPQPTSAAEVSGTSFGDLHALDVAHDGALDERAGGGEVPDRLAVEVNGWVALPSVLRHAVGVPDAHSSHMPQAASVAMMTWSPGTTWVTASPTSATMPAASWPHTAGRRHGVQPAHEREVAVAQPGGHDLDDHIAGSGLADLHGVDEFGLGAVVQQRTHGNPPVVVSPARAI